MIGRRFSRAVIPGPGKTTFTLRRSVEVSAAAQIAMARMASKSTQRTRQICQLRPLRRNTPSSSLPIHRVNALRGSHCQNLKRYPISSLSGLSMMQ